jgi:UDP-glucose:(heptosyl)LPS alpha-1,3-glucosyltransferase
MPIKIALITEQAEVSLGGAERSVFELASGLHLFGAEVQILAAKGSTDAKNVHILCPQNLGKRVNFFIFEQALKKHLSENKYDIIHSVLPFDFADIYQPRGGSYPETIVRNAASYQNRFVVAYKRIFSVFNTRRTTLLRAERKIAEATDTPIIAALSQYVAQQFKQHYNTNPQRIAVIPNGVIAGKKIDDNQVYALRSQIMTKLGIKEADNPIFFLFAANNFRLKGLAPLIKAMKIAAERSIHGKPCLIVAGSDKVKKYQRLASSLGINNIVFLGALGNIQKALVTADVAVLPTFYDPASRIILEALIEGKPVITTKYNGATDLFTNNRHGKVIDSPTDYNALADAIVYFTDTNNIQLASQAITKDNLRQELSINRVAGQLMEVYESIMQKKGRQ